MAMGDVDEEVKRVQASVMMHQRHSEKERGAGEWRDRGCKDHRKKNPGGGRFRKRGGKEGKKKEGTGRKVERKKLEKGEVERESRDRKEMGLTDMQGPWGRAGGAVSRPLPAATRM